MPPNTKGAVTLGTRNSLTLPWQAKTWRFYGAPDGTVSANVRLNQGAIGEVRFVMGWIAQQIARVGWHIDIDGKRLDDEEALRLVKLVANEESTVIIATNLIVAGELNYIALSPETFNKILGPDWQATAGPGLPGEDDKRWLTVSVIDDKRKDLLEAAQEGLDVRGIWPHPARPIAPDPPLKSVLDVLEEIEQLQDLAFSQNRSRIANMGILTIANELELSNSLPNGAGTNTGDQIEMVINSPIADPRQSSAAPIIFRAPFEYMTGALSNGARAIQWTRPELEYAESLEGKMKFAIQRLAWGFPVAPEILLGMTATNRAVAFQIEETTYRSHIEPIARLVGRIYARALTSILDGNEEVEVLPDATDLLARRHSVADAKDMYDRGLVKGEFVRRVAGVDEEDAGTQEDLDRISFLRKGNNPGEARELDPSEVAGNQPVRASAATGELAFGALEGALSMAYASAVSRVGAAARTKMARNSVSPDLGMGVDLCSISNRRLPSILGLDRLNELGVNLPKTLHPVGEWLKDVWEERIIDDREDLNGSEEMAESLEILASEFTEWAANHVCTWPAPVVPSALIAAAVAPLYLESEDQGVET